MLMEMINDSVLIIYGFISCSLVVKFVCMGENRMYWKYYMLQCICSSSLAWAFSSYILTIMIKKIHKHYNIWLYGQG